MTTGFDKKRAEHHDDLVEALVVILAERGYKPRRLLPDGDGPDIELLGGAEYIELKTRNPGQPNYAIKLGCLDHARSSPKRIYFLFDNGMVNTIDTLKIVAGPFRPTGNGSTTDYVLVSSETGAPSGDFFMARENTS